MSTQQKPITRSEMRKSLEDGDESQFPPVMTSEQAAKLLSIPKKTIDEWRAKGRLDGTYRKRGRHVRFWRDRLLQRFFNGPEWDND